MIIQDLMKNFQDTNIQLDISQISTNMKEDKAKITAFKGVSSLIYFFSVCLYI